MARHPTTTTTAWAAAACALALSVAACSPAPGIPGPLADAYEVTGPVFDLEAAPDGGLLVTQGTTITRIDGTGVHALAEVPTHPGSPLNGLAALDDGSVLATSGGLDLTVGAGLWRVVDGESELVADIAAFALEHHPDAQEGPRWKDPQCEIDQGFTPGPQTNPYHFVALTANDSLIADAAGNTLLAASVDGDVDWVAVFTPPVDEEGEWRVLNVRDDDTVCYVEPVPTAVDVGPDGAWYVGELTGIPGVPGWARVWRVEAGSTNVVCPSDACEEVLSGLTSVVDVLFGPGGELYVVELDRDGWLAAVMGEGGGGVLKRCDVATGTCEVVEEADRPLAAITIDASGRLWVVENESLTEEGVSVVRRVEVP